MKGMRIVKKSNQVFFIGALLLIAGIVWAIAMNRVGTTAWILLLVGVVIGILAGFIQGWAIRQQEQGKIGPGKRATYIVGAIVLLVAVKVALNILFPSYIATSQSGIWLSVVIAVGGLLLGRAWYDRQPTSMKRSVAGK